MLAGQSANTHHSVNTHFEVDGMVQNMKIEHLNNRIFFREINKVRPYCEGPASLTHFSMGRTSHTSKNNSSSYREYSKTHCFSVTTIDRENNLTHNYFKLKQLVPT